MMSKLFFEKERPKVRRGDREFSRIGAKIVLGRKQKLDIGRVECYSHRIALVSIHTSLALVYGLGLM